MASQHNRSSSYRALIDGNHVEAVTREEELHARVMGEGGERKPHGLPSDEVLNEELKTMKVNPNSYSSIAGASSSTFHQYRKARTIERNRIEKMYADAEREIKQKEFEDRKRERAEEEQQKTASRAAKRQKKKDNKKQRAAEFKDKAKSEKGAEATQEGGAGGDKKAGEPA